MGNKIKLGLIGGGLSSFIGIVHRVAAYMGENYVLTGGVFDIDFDKGKITNKLKKAKDLSDKGQDISIIDEQDFFIAMSVAKLLTASTVTLPQSEHLVDYWLAHWNVSSNKYTSW